MSRLDADGMLRLLARVLDGTPGLDGAACTGRGALFDPIEPDEDQDDARYRVDRAVDLCRACPALAVCAQWTEALAPSRRPAGTIAARPARIPRAPGRPKKKENTAA